MITDRKIKRFRKKAINMLFVLPLLAVNITFFLIPFVKSLYMSLYDWPLLGEKTFNGISNFIKAFQDAKFIL